VYLVFATLIVPALATRNAARRRLLKAYAVAALGYGVGLLASAWLDLPSGAVVVWALAVAGIAFFSLERQTLATTSAPG
jgi:zinc/manganese transport system permease protein